MLFHSQWFFSRWYCQGRMWVHHQEEWDRGKAWSLVQRAGGSCFWDGKTYCSKKKAEERYVNEWISIFLFFWDIFRLFLLYVYCLLLFFLVLLLLSMTVRRTSESYWLQKFAGIESSWCKCQVCFLLAGVRFFTAGALDVTVWIEPRWPWKVKQKMV